MPPDAPRGLTVATVLPFHADGAIDWRSYDNLLAFCAVPSFTSAVFVNGHAGEGATLTIPERAEVIRRTRAAIGTKPLMAGIIAFSTAESIAETERALAAGADIAVLFPPPSFAAGGTRTPDVPLAFVRAVLDATRAPVSIFQQPLASGLGFTTETLAAMAALPGVVAIKEGSDTMTAYEDNWRAVKSAAPDCAVLPSNFDWFMPQCAVGADGILSGLGSLCPALLHALWTATEAQDLPAMRAASDRLYPVVRSIYAAPPRMDMHTRIKAALVALGVIADATPRAPLLPLSPGITARVVAAAEALREPTHA